MTFNLQQFNEEQEKEFKNELEQQVFMFFNNNNPIEDSEWSLKDENREYLYKIVEKTIAELEERAKKYLPNFLKSSNTQLLKSFLEGEVENLQEKVIWNSKNKDFVAPYINGYEHCLDDQITHYKTLINTLE